MKNSSALEDSACRTLAPRVGCIVMASGEGRRFGANKLLAAFNGEPLLARTLRAVPPGRFARVLVVSRWPGCIEPARAAGCETLLHAETLRSAAVRLGIHSLAGDTAAPLDGCLFLPGDQPLCCPESIAAMLDAFAAAPGCIVRLAWQGKAGSPVLFPRRFFAELCSLEGTQGGGAVAKRHPDAVRIVEAGGPEELMDVDTPEALAALARADTLRR